MSSLSTEAYTLDAQSSSANAGLLSQRGIIDCVWALKSCATYSPPFLVVSNSGVLPDVGFGHLRESWLELAWRQSDWAVLSMLDLCLVFTEASSG